MINIRNTALAVLIQTHTQWFQIAKREREREKVNIFFHKNQDFICKFRSGKT